LGLAVLQRLNRSPCSIHDRQVRARNGPSVSKYEPPSITVFTLTDVQDLSPRDIAVALGLIPETVRRLINRGFDRLTNAAKKEGLHFETRKLQTLIPLSDTDEEKENDDE